MMMRRTYKSKARSIKVASSSPAIKPIGFPDTGRDEWGGENVQTRAHDRIITQGRSEAGTASAKAPAKKTGNGANEKSQKKKVQVKQSRGKPPLAPASVNPVSKQPVVNNTKKPLLLQDKTNAQSVPRPTSNAKGVKSSDAKKPQKAISSLKTATRITAPKSLLTLPPRASSPTATSSFSLFPLPVRSLKQSGQQLGNGKKRHKAHRPLFLPQQSKKLKLTESIDGDQGRSFQVYKDPAETIKAVATVQENERYYHLFV
jgi:hypothetical protein